MVSINTGGKGGLEYEAKQLRWLGLILILAGAVSLGLAACEKKEAEFSQLLGKKKGVLTIDLEEALP